MTTHPGDKPVQRFVAYIVGFIAMFGFAVLAPILAFSGAVIWPVRSASEELGKQRAERSKVLREEQSARLGAAATDPATKTVHVPVRWAMDATLPQLKNKAAVATTAVVPGSAAALKAASAPPPPVVGPAVSAPAAGPKPPAAPKPAAADSKPAAPAPTPAAPASKPATSASKPATSAPKPAASAPKPAVKPALVPTAPASSPKP